MLFLKISVFKQKQKPVFKADFLYKNIKSGLMETKMCQYFGFVYIKKQACFVIKTELSILLKQKKIRKVNFTFTFKKILKAVFLVTNYKDKSKYVKLWFVE